MTRTTMLLGLIFATAAAQAAAPPPPADTARTRHDWAWLGADGGTYWIVPQAFLKAIQWNTDDPDASTAIDDQTVWHIQRYDNGYFFGPVVAQLSGRPAMCQYLIGSVTPEGRVYITFNSQPAAPQATPALTTGFGEMTPYLGRWAFGMQMASGSASMQVTHWAYMTQCSEGQACWNDLPGVDESVPAMLANCDDD